MYRIIMNISSYICPKIYCFNFSLIYYNVSHSYRNLSGLATQDSENVLQLFEIFYNYKIVHYKYNYK